MRGFQFRLHRALRFALLRENQKKGQVANARKRIAFLEKYLAQLSAKIRTSFAESNKAIHGLSAEAHRQAIVPAIEESKRLTVLLAEEYEAIDERKKELVHLSQRRRSLEALEEKQAAEFKLERSRRDQKKIDEAVNLTRNRQIPAGKT